MVQETLDFFKDGTHNTKVLLRCLLLCGKNTLSQAFGIQKENWGNHIFVRDNQASTLKNAVYIIMYFIFYLIIFVVSLFLKNAGSANFLFGFQ